MRTLSLLLACIALVPAADEPAPMDQASPPEPFDPFLGMDRNGRIPKVDFPADIEHPERWRYVPEGRIKPGSMLERFWVTSFIAPILYYEEDIGLGGGVAVTDIDFRQQRRREFAGIFLSTSTEGQKQYKIIWQRWLNHRNLLNGGILM